LARMSTDEFAIVKSISCLSEVAELAATIVGVVQSTYLVEGRVIYLGANVGMAFAPEQACTSGQLLRRADLALQRSQQVGDGTVCFYSSEMDEEAKHWQEIQRDLQSALLMLRWEWMRKPQMDAAAGSTRSPEDLHGVNQALLNRSRRSAAARKLRSGHGTGRRCANRKSS
jgi:predicted signal transduction protein with EAL and GGDEF domain